jgi:chromosomal replication initiation ATPase DnaA
MKDAALIGRVISSFANDSEDIYRHLYLYGNSSGCARTVEKLVVGYKTTHPDVTVFSYTGNAFVGRVLDNVMMESRFADTKAVFVSLLSQCSLLVLENIQDIARKAESMQQLYIILDKRLENNLPFIVTGNTVPSAIHGLAPRISAILEGSLLIGLV